MRAPLQLVRLWYSLGGLMLILVAVLSLMPLKLDSVAVSDKSAHLATYAALSAWFGLLAANRGVLWRGALGLLVYGALIELLQHFTGYRSAEWEDLLANAAGILLGMLAYPAPLRRLLGSVDARAAALLQRLGFFPFE